jgi:glyoxylase-like metal-dependent hydrolase (beta-lactamase superfamily II)
MNRREFVNQLGCGAVGLAELLRARPAWSAAEAPALPPAADALLTKITEHLWVYQGWINVGIIRDGQKSLLIDCGDGSVLPRLRQQGVNLVDWALFTHHHRDQACGAPDVLAAGARLGVPHSERAYFDKVSAYWNDPKHRWHLYSYHPHHLMLAEPVPVQATYKDGQSLSWGPAQILAVATPGHTDGSLSYAVDIDGRRIVFSGDCLYDEGRVWEIYSLQKGIQTTDYHGFLGARPQLIESLGRIKAVRPQLLVPSHGRIMDQPARAIDALVARLDLCYDRYVAISALRHYFPKMFAAYAGRKEHMPIRTGKPAPTCLRHVGTSWILVAADRTALVMDCGSTRVVQTLQDLLRKGEIRAVEGLWVTHYHDDHVDGIPEFQKAFSCPCFTDRSVAEVISDPPAWRLPCISPNRARVDRATRDGESWPWHEFKLTAYHLPGQTLYHAGLLVEGQGLRMLFVGDSFTMAGIDDYCCGNRNWLGPGVGFDRCLALIERMKPTHIFNCHVNEAFDFTPEECRFMRANLAEREKLFGELVPWDHANYGMDEPWVRCHPYEQKVTEEKEVVLTVIVTNHSAQSRIAACRPVFPRCWDGNAPRPSAEGASAAVGQAWTTISILPKTEGRLRLTFRVPRGTKPGRYVVPIDLRYGKWSLPQFAEAIVTVA